MALTTHRRLDLSSDEIRVLVLQPGKGDAPIHAHLTLTTLHNNLQYEALSYVWGDPGATKPIQLRATDDMNSLGMEVEVQITTNLESALRHLRLNDRSRTLWADAICINQNDPDEKIHQIRNMDNIYRKASSVCMWLGEEANDSDAAMELINLHRNDTPEWRALRQVKDLSRQCKALTYLICRPWFTRRWIVQEIMLARCNVVYCGTRSTTWNALYRATYSLASETHKYEMSLITGGTRLPNWHPFKSWLCSDEHYESWARGIDHIIQIQLAIVAVTRDRLPTLSTLLKIFHRKNVTDPRDAVYALLSLSKEHQHAQPNIDYTAEILDVFRNAVELSVQVNETLDIICQSFGLGSCQHELSWVPRFYTKFLDCACHKHNDLPSSSEPYRSESPYSTSGLLKPEASFNGHKLVAKGFVIDRVRNILEPETRHALSLEVPLSWKEAVLSLDAICIDGGNRGHETLATDHASKFNAFWRTLVTDRVPGNHKNKRAPKNWSRACEKWCNGNMVVPLYSHTLEVGKHRSCLSLIFAAIWRSTLGRRFMITEMNRIGLGPDTLQDGDLVCVLLGCSVPVILRPTTDLALAGCYCFVGESYVHGIMDGEAGTRLEAGDYTLEDLAIV